jgi:hypothetical protein
MDHFISLLDKWKIQDTDSAIKESIPLRIIEEAELILQTRNILESERTFWLDFLNIQNS